MARKDLPISRQQKQDDRFTTVPRRMKRLTLDLDTVLHRAIKMDAAKDGVTMVQKLRALLSKHYRIAEERDTNAARTPGLRAASGVGTQDRR